VKLQHSDEHNVHHPALSYSPPSSPHFIARETSKNRNEARYLTEIRYIVIILINMFRGYSTR
jgi:hypothetical protein